MAIYNSPDIFQENISGLFEWLDKVCTNIDNVLVIIKEKYMHHIKAMGKVLQKLAEMELKVNTEKYFFGKTETE